MPKRRVGNLPIRSGDKLTVSVNGKERKGKVKKATGHKVVAMGEFGKTTLTVTNEDGEVEARIDVEEKDEEGRVRLAD